MERRVSLFRDGDSQAVRIPPEFELPGTEVVIRKDGERLVMEPVRRSSLIEYLKTAEPIDEEWPEIDDPPPDPVEL